jgi:arylsulfatase A-like enzyme
VGAILDALTAHHELAETLVIFTSDNGYLQGEHRVRYGKLRHYEPSSRVPLIVRGPGVPKGETVSEVAINADLAPTILDATNSSPGLEQDGRSLIDLAQDPRLGRNRALLFETTTYTAIRTARYKYVEHYGGANQGAIELYDLKLDPFELRSQHANPAYAGIRDLLQDQLAELRNCAGEGCRSKLASLDLEAKKQKLKSKVAFYATANIPSTLVARGKAIKKTAKELARKQRTKIKAKLKRAKRKRLAHELDETGRAKIKLKATATASSVATARDTVRVKFKEKASPPHVIGQP